MEMGGCLVRDGLKLFHGNSLWILLLEALQVLVKKFHRLFRGDWVFMGGGHSAIPGCTQSESRRW
jgi:hypothetical protein